MRCLPLASSWLFSFKEWVVLFQRNCNVGSKAYVRAEFADPVHLRLNQEWCSGGVGGGMIYMLSRACLTFHPWRECLRMKLFISPSKIRPKLQIVITNISWVRTMCQALCFVFSLHYITDSSRPKEVGTRKPDSGKLRNLSTITQQIK